MSSWSESLPRPVVRRGSDARAVRPARIGADLRSTPWVSTHGADPRLCDPTLEAVVAAEASTAVAEALVGHHLEVADCPAREAVERALSLAPAGGVAVVRLHPDDVDAVAARGPLAPDRSLTLVPDPQVERGGCVVDAGERRIDGQIGPALERVRAVLES